MSVDVVPKLAHCGLQPLGRDRRSRPRHADIKRTEQLGYPFDRVARAIDVAVPEPPMQAVEGFGDERAGASFGACQTAKPFGSRLGDLDSPRQMCPVEERRRGEPSLFQISPEHLVAIGERRDPRGIALTQILKCSFDQLVRTAGHADDSANLQAATPLVGAHPDQDLVMPGTRDGSAPDESSVDPQVDGARATISIRHQCIGFARDLPWPVQDSPSRRIGGEAFSEWEEITNDCPSRAVAHERAETASDLIIVAGRPGRTADATRSRKARSRPHEAGKANDEGSEQGLDRAGSVVFEHQARISPSEQKRFVFAKLLLQSNHRSLDCSDDPLARLETQSDIIDSVWCDNFANIAYNDAPARSVGSRFHQFKPPSHKNSPARRWRHPPKSPHCPQDPHVWNSPVRDIGIDSNISNAIPEFRFTQFVREGGVAPAFLLSEYSINRRRATLVSAVIDLEAKLSDSAIQMFDRLVAGMFTRARRGPRA